MGTQATISGRPRYVCYNGKVTKLGIGKRLTEVQQERKPEYSSQYEGTAKCHKYPDLDQLGMFADRPGITLGESWVVGNERRTKQGGGQRPSIGRYIRRGRVSGTMYDSGSCAKDASQSVAEIKRP